MLGTTYSSDIQASSICQRMLDQYTTTNLLSISANTNNLKETSSFLDSDIFIEESNYLDHPAARDDLFNTNNDAKVFKSLPVVPLGQPLV